MGRVSDAREKLMDAVWELIWTGSYGTTTIDQICEKAGVKKGSFYYFFDSKADVAVEALESSWQKRRGELDSIFSATVPPLERLQKYCEFSYNVQVEIRAKFGRVLGCPQVALGCEVCTQEDALQKKIQSIIDYKRRYLESAIREAHNEGLVNAPDPASKARMVMAYYDGLLTQARIQNNVELLREMWLGVSSLLDVTAGRVPA
jgi:TetR/AcrR family transcriptional regulator, transcriptional repressor for nem operon